MALATQADVEADLGRVLSVSEAPRVASLLTKASAIVSGYTRASFVEPYPEAVVAVAAGMVARIFETSSLANVEQQNAGPFGVRYATGSTSSSPWLTKGDKLALRPYRVGGGLGSVQAVGTRYEITETE